MKVIYSFLLLLLFACDTSKNSQAEIENKKWEEFLEVTGDAEFTDDTAVITQAIDNINTILENDGEKYITNLYEVKARLLFRLNRHDEAMETLDKTKHNHDVQKAALLILMNKDEEAREILDNFIAVYMESINEGINIETSHAGILVVLSLLSGKSFNDILENNTNPGLNIAMLQDWADKFEITREDILQSMWPQPVGALPDGENS